MNDRKDQDGLDRIIRQAVDLGTVTFDRAKWLDRLAAQAREPVPPSRQTHHPEPGRRRRIWRIIMESKATRYSVAATIVAAAALILTNPFGFLGRSHGVALAEAVEKMDAVETMVLKEQRNFYELGQEEPFLRAQVVKYCSSRHGVVEEQYDEQGNLMARAYILKEAQQLIFVFPQGKQYLKLPMSESWARIMDYLTPKALVAYFQSGDYKELGPSRCDGHDVEGFEVTDTSLFPLADQQHFLFRLFPVEAVQWRFWIDTKTLLLAGADLEVTTGRGLFTLFKRMRVTCHDYDIQYNQEIPAAVFDPNIPDDYTPLNLGSLAEKNAAWLGVGAVPVAAGIVVHRRRHRHAGARQTPGMS
ncbi:MAG: hypothetical protein MUC88_15865 [Planctomycetes bacterium]|jgi:hypothetical protein|nr:hypothetical protein [Planctomycetota bacterium]